MHMARARRPSPGSCGLQEDLLLSFEFRAFVRMPTLSQGRQGPDHKGAFYG